MAALGIVLFGLAGGIAYAMIPDSTGVIHGCYAKKGGSLRVIDTDAGQSCKPGEAALDWNQQGPTGPPGQAATVLWAVVAADGTLARGSHVVSVAHTPGENSYDVTFDQDVRQCAFLATLGGAAGEIPSGGEITDGRDAQTNGGVEVKIFAGPGSGAEMPFHLAVFC